MALIKCPECGENISEYAYKCQKCGKENQKRRTFNDIDINEKDYESKYFSYVPVDLEKRKNKNKVISVTIVISAILIVLIAMNIRSTLYKKQIQDDADKFSVLAEMLGTRYDIRNHTYYVSNTANEYVNYGMILFGDIDGIIKVYDNNTYEISSVKFRSYERASSTKNKQIIEELNEIYGKYNMSKLYSDNTITYTWDEDSYTVTMYSVYDSQSFVEIEWSSK